MRWKNYFLKSDGLAAVEFALIAPFLVALLMGMIDFGMFINQRMQLENLARSAAEYVVKGGDEANVMADVITSSGKIPVEEMPEVEFESGDTCECSETGEEITCGDSCDNGYQRRFFTYSMTRTYTPMFPYPGIPEEISIRGHARLQVE